MAKKTLNTSLILVVILPVLVGVFLGSCKSFERDGVVVLPLVMPGAEYVGAEMCGECHETETRYFQLSDHASVSLEITEEEAEDGVVDGCETCHGPGSLHIEEYGDKTKIIKADADTCFTCHLEIKGQFLLQHHHPVPEEKMTCSDCHNMHGKDVRATGGNLLLDSNEVCFNCHKDQKGPFLFEHDVMRDGCTSCHNPHGSINDKLLVAGQTITCINCHWESSFNNDSTGSLGVWPHGLTADIGRGSECIDCHTAPHGSNIDRSLRR